MLRFKTLGVIVILVALLSMSGAVVWAEQDQPQYGGTAIFGIHYSAPVALDPIRVATDKSYDIGVIRCIHRGLVLLDTAKLEVVPAIAGSWEIRENGKTYTFHLRKDVNFHNGREVKAQDFKYSFERLMDPEEAAVPTYILEGVEGIKVIDDYTLQITLKTANPLFLYGLAEPGASVIPKEEYERMGPAEFSKHPVGAGPFKIATWVGNDIALEAFDDFYGGRPYLDKIEFRWMIEAGARESAFEAKEIDEHLPTPIQYRGYREEIPEQLIEVPELYTRHIGFNTEWGPFTDKRVRQAFNYAIDKETIIEKFLMGKAYLAVGWLPSSLPAFNPELKGYDYNPGKAKELLEEAGYPNGFTVEIIGHPTHPAWGIPAVEAAMPYLEAVGIKVKPVAMEAAEVYFRLGEGKFEAYIQSFPTSFGSPLVRWHSDKIGTLNYVRYNNSEFDRLLDQASKEADFDRRMQLVREAEEIFVEDAPMWFFNYNKAVAVYQPWVHGLEECGAELFWQPYWKVWVDETSPRKD